MGKPYLHLEVDRALLPAYGLTVGQVLQHIELGIGGKAISHTVEGRIRRAVRLRYPRELRGSPTEIGEMLIQTPKGIPVPLKEVCKISYARGPQMIKSENTFLMGYVLLDKAKGYSDVEAVELAQQYLDKKLQSGELRIPSGVSYAFSGTYEQQVRAEKRLSLLIPAVLSIILLILYSQFKSLSTALMVFASVALAFSGGFLMLYCYQHPELLPNTLLGIDLGDVFQMKGYNLSVAVWVGFIALFGIATDDGVLIGTYLMQSSRKMQPDTEEALKESVVNAGKRRIRPAIMTSATTLIALLPVLTSTGKGSDIMIPMAIPAFGGMLLASLGYFLLPVLYFLRERWRIHRRNRSQDITEN